MLKHIQGLMCRLGKHSWPQLTPHDGDRCRFCGRQYLDPNLTLRWL